MVLQPQIGIPTESLINFIACSCMIQEHRFDSHSAAQETAVVSSHFTSIFVTAHNLANILSIWNTSLDLENPAL